MKEVTFTAGESNPILTINPTTGEITQKTAVDTSGFVSTTLNSGRVLVGSPGNAATQVDTASVGDISADTTNGLQIKAGAIVNADINASAAIAYSKLALTGSIVNADVNASAAIAYSKLNLTGSITNADINAAAAIARTKLASGSSHRVIVNNASGVMTDAAAITANRVLVSNNDGIPVAAIPTTTEINRVAGVTSPIQTQLNSNIVGIAADSLVTNPTASEDGYAITWDNTAGEWTLIDPVVTGLPTGGTAGQFIIKNSGTNFDVSWADFEWANISDVSTTLADVELLSGLDAAGLTNAELQNLIGTTSNIQSQLTNKQDRSLTHNSIWVGNVSNIPTALSAGTNGYVLTITSGSPSWQPSVAGFSNPMTTEGDLIIGDTGGAAIRLGIGTNGHVLTSNGTTASWQAPSGGVSDGDKGDITVSSSGTVWTVDANINKAWTGTHSFVDGNLSIIGSVDATKIAKFEVDGFTTATTRTFTLPDASGTVALTSDLSGWLTGTLTGNATVNLFDGVDYHSIDIGGTVITDEGDVSSSISDWNLNAGGLSIGNGAGEWQFGFWKEFNPKRFFVDEINFDDGSSYRSSSINFYGHNEIAAGKYRIFDINAWRRTVFRIEESTSSFDDTTFTTLNVGSDATGDTYYRNSSGYFTRLPIGTTGQVLTVSGSGIPSWAAPTGGGWNLTGNSGTVDGTNFIGTTDNIPFNIRVNNQKAGRIESNSQGNSFYGYQSGNIATNNSANTGIGYNTLSLVTTGDSNTAVGYNSQPSTTGIRNSSFGAYSLYTNSTGSSNTAIGMSSLYLTSGSHNVGIGAFSLSTNTTGSNNIAIGSLSDVSTGNLTNAIAIGYGAIVSSSNTIQLGNASITEVYIGTSTTAKLISGQLQITGGTLSSGYVLTSDGSGNATWAAPTSGFADPMTTRGDIIYRNSSNATARLGAGTAGQVLTSDGTDIAWATPSGGGNFLKSDGNTTLLNNIIIDGDTQTYGVNFQDLADFEVTADALLNLTSGNDATITATTGFVTLDAAQEINLDAGTDIVITNAPDVSTAGELLLRNTTSGNLERLGIGANLSISAGNLTATGGGSSVLSDITAATGANTINSGANHQIWDWNSLTSGTGMSFRSSSTDAASNTLQVVSIEKSGANSNSTQTTTSLNVSNTSTGTTSTNIAGYFAASGGTTNISLHSFGETVLETTVANPNINLRSSSGADWLRFINTRYLAFYPTVNGNLRITPSSSALGLEFMSPGSSVNLANRFAFTWSGAVTGTSAGTDILVVSGENQGGTKIGATLSSGSKNFGLFKASGAWNFTGTYSGTLIGYDYDPTLISTTGLTNLSFRATSGNMLVPASSFVNFGTTSGSSGYGFRDNSGTMEFKNNAGSWTAFGGGLGGSVGSVDNALLRADVGSGVVQASSVIISDTADISLGTVSLSGNRSISVVSSSTDASLTISAQGEGSIQYNGTSHNFVDGDYRLSIFPDNSPSGVFIGAFSGNVTPVDFTISNFTGGNASFNDGGNLIIQAGIAYDTSGNGSGGHVGIYYGTKRLAGSGLTGNIGIGGLASNWQSMEGGVFTNNVVAAPTGNPANGVFEYATDVEGTAEKYIRTESGAVVSASGLLEPVEVSGNTLTLSEAHRGKFLYFTNAAGCTVTVPTTLKKGFSCIMMQDAAGAVSTTGATVNGKTATTAQYDKIGLVHYKDTDIYYGA